MKHQLEEAMMPRIKKTRTSTKRSTITKSIKSTKTTKRAKKPTVKVTAKSAQPKKRRSRVASADDSDL